MISVMEVYPLDEQPSLAARLELEKPYLRFSFSITELLNLMSRESLSRLKNLQQM